MSSAAAPARDSGTHGKQEFQQTHQQFAGRSRFYKGVSVDAVSGVDDSERYRVLLDGRELKTPARNPLHLESVDVAMLIAGEWDAQTSKKRGIQPATMPFMTLAATAIDQVSTDEGRSRARATCMGYLPTDTLLFFTEARDRILLKKQKKHFDPLLKWFRQELQLPLNQTDGGMVLKVGGTAPPCSPFLPHTTHCNAPIQLQYSHSHSLSHGHGHDRWCTLQRWMRRWGH
jgi:chaperone required for assembly of F1-ATPase